MPAASRIHPTAVVAPGAELAADVTVGPFAVVGPEVRVGPGAAIGPHAVVEGRTILGAGVQVFQFASVGAAPQDLKYRGEPTETVVGEGTILREFVTVHRGTAHGDGVTRIGNRCLLMAYCHVAHDCRVGDQVVMANGATLGGHVQVGDHVVIGGLSAVHQFCRIGDYAFLGGMSGVNKDVPPYVKYWGQRGRIYGLNLVGLRRNGFRKEVLDSLREAYRMLFQAGEPVGAALEKALDRFGEIPEIRRFLDFIAESQRGIPQTGDEEEPF
ncbi:acyl-ACP--UDP-N-acetylglucosamine O-acyltransferase [Dissulfurirhabdus thermomarina]|uniref:Acyl-[acyl-carrier-protein]--UDP-N-acetylglucosamine O-acyltransferase n=1 Tax=Dissulfurirhabdus thermomarina TaxID=1765737 RepID=A0A6N9TWC8_DISTH|nr:acyl-ACP--UDP-N-acetylglucosamine O-acyltransferase [Dissulfurirhabdus thermomarina]NDY42786.1 acyl-ACP--UDP-N-acetylglucosamine O-acyltransferase [Dissulfurirhabdus thermomarina]NMX23558.1 acyl-ACP--UDP-N-acetylglucosamine O-acyltransferase [Dissulfurirhabdus thermomarina]